MQFPDGLHGVAELKIVWTIRPWERWTLGVIAFVAAIGATIAGVAWSEAHSDPRVTRYALAVPGLSEAVTLAFVSDSHVNQDALASSVDLRRLVRIVEQVNALKPDMVVLGGDYLATSHRAGDVRFDRAVAPFGALRSRYGTFAVIGNHDCQEPENTTAVMVAGLRSAGAVPIVNSSARAGPVQMAGLDDLWCGDSDIATASKAVAEASGRPVVLVSHNPDVFPAVPRSVALTLAGHTHGAQIVPPVIGPIVTVSRYGQRYRYGLIEETGRRMIVSSGLGGLPLRWNAPPEIVLVTLRPVSTGSSGRPAA